MACSGVFSRCCAPQDDSEEFFYLNVLVALSAAVVTRLALRYIASCCSCKESVSEEDSLETEEETLQRALERGSSHVLATRKEVSFEESQDADVLICQEHTDSERYDLLEQSRRNRFLVGLFRGPFANRDRRRFADSFLSDLNRGRSSHQVFKRLFPKEEGGDQVVCWIAGGRVVTATRGSLQAFLLRKIQKVWKAIPLSPQGEKGLQISGIPWKMGDCLVIAGGVSVEELIAACQRVSSMGWLCRYLSLKHGATSVTASFRPLQKLSEEAKEGSD